MGFPANSSVLIFFMKLNLTGTLKILFSVSISLKNFNFFKTLIWTGELRQAIVSMMLRKDEIEEKNRYESLSGKCVVFFASKTILWIPVFLQPLPFCQF